MKTKINKILFIVSTHGDERESLEVVSMLKKTDYGQYFDYLIANPKAYEINARFFEQDLNRLYPGKKNSKIYEERLAWENMNIAKKYSG